MSNINHQWQDVYQHGGHYPDGKRCNICNLFDLPQTPKYCGQQEEKPESDLIEGLKQDRSAIFAALRKAKVDDDVFAAIASITHARISKLRKE